MKLTLEPAPGPRAGARRRAVEFAIGLASVVV